MRIKLDENLPTRLVGILSQLGHKVDTVPEEGLKGHQDPDICMIARPDPKAPGDRQSVVDERAIR